MAHVDRCVICCKRGTRRKLESEPICDRCRGEIYRARRLEGRELQAKISEAGRVMQCLLVARDGLASWTKVGGSS